MATIEISANGQRLLMQTLKRILNSSITSNLSPVELVLLEAAFLEQKYSGMDTKLWEAGDKFFKEIWDNLPEDDDSFNSGNHTFLWKS